MLLFFSFLVKYVGEHGAASVKMWTKNPKHFLSRDWRVNIWLRAPACVRAAVSGRDQQQEKQTAVVKSGSINCQTPLSFRNCCWPAAARLRVWAPSCLQALPGVLAATCGGTLHGRHTCVRHFFHIFQHFLRAFMCLAEKEVICRWQQLWIGCLRSQSIIAALKAAKLMQTLLHGLG